MSEDFADTYTMAQAETKVKEAANKLSFITLDYTRAGDQLTEATIAHRRAVTIAEFDRACPQVGAQVLVNVVDGKDVYRKVTVGDREAWLNKTTEKTRVAELAAETMRENALEMLRTARYILQAAMAINASAREAYRSAVPT